MTAKRIHRVASFGSEIMQALLRGAREHFAVGPLPYRKAVSFAQRVNQLRSAMRNEDHEHNALVAKARVRVVWGEKAGYTKVLEKHNSRNVPSPLDLDTPAKLIIEPHDREFNEVLVKSGIRAEDLTDDPVASFTPKGGDTSSPTKVDYLDTIFNENNKKLP